MRLNLRYLSSVKSDLFQGGGGGGGGRGGQKEGRFYWTEKGSSLKNVK